MILSYLAIKELTPASVQRVHQIVQNKIQKQQEQVQGQDETKQAVVEREIVVTEATGLEVVTEADEHEDQQGVVEATASDSPAAAQEAPEKQAEEEEGSIPREETRAWRWDRFCPRKKSACGVGRLSCGYPFSKALQFDILAEFR